MVQPPSILTARKEEILDAARLLFSQNGYRTTSMRDLAEALRIKPASLYSHYRSKDEMLWELSLRSASAFHERVLPLADASGSPQARLFDMLQQHVLVIFDHLEASAIFFREWKYLDAPRREQYSAYIKAYETAFARVIAEGIETGDLRKGSPQFLTHWVLASCNWVHRWYRPDGGWKPEAIAAEVATLGLQGLRQSP